MIARLLILASLLAIAATAVFALQDLRIFTAVTEDVTGTAVRIGKPDAVTPDADAAKKRLSLVTYNILVHPVALDRRGPALMRILKESGADIIALQEVDDWFIRLLEKEDWPRGYYRVNAEPADCGGQFILSRVPVKKARCHRLPGPQGRTVLIASLDMGRRALEVATTHAESALEDGEIRARQLDLIFAQVARADDAVVLGDFNCGDGAPERSRIPPSYQDLWTKLRPEEHGYTWDNEKSDMAGKSRERFPGEGSRRLDWILLRSDVWRPAEVKIIGDEPITPGNTYLFPSDHFGVSGVITRD
jgi:tyrosyl-DNA phosphodiesterase 2